ncbi:MAG: sel1 repeat family protein [Thermoanaerobaculia bacterium]|nr:sel1 repeat family protein [Thermoanaerobaculia bacterium]
MIGTWLEFTSFKMTGTKMEFFKDSTCTFESGGDRMQCGWTDTGDGRIKVSLTAMGTTEVYFNTGQGDHFLLDKGGATKARFVRSGPSADAVVARVKANDLAAQAELLRQKALKDKGDTGLSNLAEARRMALEAAGMGSVTGQVLAAQMLAAGEGGERNVEQAYDLYRKSADAGYLWAANNFAWTLATASDEAERNGAEALSYAEKALRQVQEEGMEAPWSLHGTHAAALARVGAFERAIDAQEAALSALAAAMNDGWKPDAPLIAGVWIRMLQYRQSKPFTEGTLDFEIARMAREGVNYVPRLGAEAMSLKFFEAGRESPPISARTYSSRFDRQSARYIYWQIGLRFSQPTTKAQDVRFAYSYSREGRPVGSGSHSGTIAAGFTTYSHWASWGWRDPGRWAPGEYRVNVSVDNLPVTSGTFVVE